MADKKKKKETASKTVEKLVDEISKLSVLELSELVNELKDKLGVEAAPVAAAVPAGAPAEGAAEEKPAGAAKQTVVMTAAGDQKIAVIKALREVDRNLGLKEAKDATENVPFEVIKDIKAEEAKEAAKKLKAAGATVELK